MGSVDAYFIKWKGIYVVCLRMSTEKTIVSYHPKEIEYSIILEVLLRRGKINLFFSLEKVGWRKKDPNSDRSDNTISINQVLRPFIHHLDTAKIGSSAFHPLSILYTSVCIETVCQKMKLDTTCI